MTEIPLNIFTELMHSAKCETGNDLDSIGFSSKYKGYKIAFHGTLEDDYDVNIDDFGKMVSSKWIEIKYKSYQLALMRIKLHRKHSDIIRKKAIELQKNSDAIDRKIEIDKYGQEGAIYSNHY